MVSPDLLASSPTFERIHAAVTAFYCGTQTVLKPAGADVWEIARYSDGKTLEGVRVRRAGKRFRFEMVRN